MRLNSCSFYWLQTFRAHSHSYAPLTLWHYKVDLNEAAFCIESHSGNKSKPREVPCVVYNLPRLQNSNIIWVTYSAGESNPRIFFFVFSERIFEMSSTLVQQLSYVVPAISITFLLVITSINVYFKIRRNFPASVNCWFCNVNTKVPYEDSNSWTCPACEQYNGFTAVRCSLNGSITKFWREYQFRMNVGWRL